MRSIPCNRVTITNGLDVEGAREDLLDLVQGLRIERPAVGGQGLGERVDVGRSEEVPPGQQVVDALDPRGIIPSRIVEENRQVLVVGELMHDQAPLVAVPTLKPKPVLPAASPVNSIISMACSRWAAGITKRSSNLASDVR